jgi:hypothetical protein
MHISHIDADHYIVRPSGIDRSWDDSHVEHRVSLDERMTFLFDNDDVDDD